jgi:D-serine dehydratase
MENTFNMNEELKKIIEIINDHKTKSNKDLIKAIDFIKNDFEKTKDNMLVLESHLSKLESTYNILLKEYKKRTDGGNNS